MPVPSCAEISQLPKVSLHDHLEGGLRPQSLIEMTHADGGRLPAEDADTLAAWFLQQSTSGSLTEYLKSFSVTSAVLQTRDNLYRVAREYVLDLAGDGVIYGEVRWAPEKNLERGLTLDEVVVAVADGIKDGIAVASTEGHTIDVRLLLAAMRDNSRSLDIAELAVRHRSNRVVGFDIAGAEQGYLPRRHRAAFDYCADHFLPTTVHAGEAAGVDSIASAVIDGRAQRLGHGVRIAQDITFENHDSGDTREALGPVARWVRDREIVLEISPSSNWQTGVFAWRGDKISDHPFDDLRRAGFAVTVNTDNKLMSGTTLTRELKLLSDTFGYGLDEIEQFQLTAAGGAFVGKNQRAELVDRIQAGFVQAKHGTTKETSATKETT